MTIATQSGNIETEKKERSPAAKQDDRPFSNLVNNLVTTMIAQLDRPTQPTCSIPVQVLRLATNKQVAAKVLTWATGYYGSGLGYSPTEIKRVEYNCDMLRFILGEEGEEKERATILSAEQFMTFYNSVWVWDIEVGCEEPETETETETEIDVIEMEVSGVVETRMGWVEKTWDGELIHHIFFERLDNKKVWLEHYRKQTQIEPTRSTVEEVAEIQVMQVMELERNLQPQPKTNPHTQWFEDLKAIASRKGYRISLYDAHLRQVIVYGRNVKLYVQFKYSGKWGVSPNFHSQPQLFDGVEEAITYVETADTPQVLIEPWVFDKASSF